jgi:hypothetical protein
MSDYRVDKITNQSGTAGAQIAGITTFSSTSGMLMPSGNTARRLVSDFVPKNIIDDGLVLYLDAGNSASYSGSGITWTDLSGNDNTGTLTNGPTYSSANGGSIVFDGVNDYVSFTSNCYNIPLNGTITELTIDVWVYWNSFPLNSIDEIVSWWETGTQTYSDGFLGVTCTANGGGTNTNPMIRFGDDWANTGSSFTASTDVNKWWNIVAVKTSNNAYVYKNSILSATKGSSLSWGFNNVLNIGRQHGAGEYINARIPNIKLYNRALSPQEIAQNFNALRSRYSI